MVTFSFNLMAIVCVIANLIFLLSKNDLIVICHKFPILGICHSNFPNLKGPRAPSQHCKKSLFQLKSNKKAEHIKHTPTLTKQMMLFYEKQNLLN